jgi:surface polysaccharide O-acyltransferase-like enzyme
MASRYTDGGRPATASRLASVESFRVVAMLIVVCIHADFLARLQREAGALGFIIDFPLVLLWWLSVPYFFLVSGFFYGKKVQAGYEPLGLLRASCVSLIWLYFIWSVLYSLFPPRWILAFSEQNIWQTLSRDSLLAWAAGVSEHLRLYLMPWYSYYHLWFLPALAVGLAAAALAAIVRLKQSTVPILVAIYISTVIAEFLLPREGPRPHTITYALLAMFFTLLGWWVSQRRTISVSLALRFIVGGGVLAVIEGVLLKVVLQASNSDQIARYPYAGAALLVLGLFMLLLCKPTWGQQTVLPTLARFTLGVYVGHIFIEHTLAPMRDLLPHLPALWHVLYVMTVYTLSVLLTWGLMQVPYLRAFVVRDNSSPVRLSDIVRLGTRPRWIHQRSR